MKVWGSNTEYATDFFYDGCQVIYPLYNLIFHYL